MPTYLEIQEQIKQLQEQAEQLRVNEIQTVIDDIKSKITLYGISASQLGFSDTSVISKNKKDKANKPPIPLKYKSDDGLHFWNGRGPRPQWIKDELAKEGALSDFLINKP